MIKDGPKYKTPYSIRLSNKRWRDKNKGYFRIHRAEVEGEDPKIREDRLITCKEYRANNKDGLAVLRTIWEMNNIKKCKASKNKWYTNNIDKQNGLRTKRRTEIRVFINSLKEGKPCTKCNVIFDPVCMDFHHPRDKEFSISCAQRMCLTNEVILEEVAKCDIMCANCHRLEHK